MSDRTTLKSYFETGDTPTQAEFADLIDSLALLTEAALKSNVLELDNTTAFTPDADYEPATKKYVDDNSGGGASSVLVTTSTNYTIDLSDAENIRRVNTATAANLNIPTYASVAFPQGTKIYVNQMGAGTVTVVALSGVTINTSAVKTPYQHGYITLIKVNTNVWDVIGGTV